MFTVFTSMHKKYPINSFQRQTQYKASVWSHDFDIFTGPEWMFPFQTQQCKQQYLKWTASVHSNLDVKTVKVFGLWTFFKSVGECGVSLFFLTF